MFNFFRSLAKVQPPQYHRFENADPSSDSSPSSSSSSPSSSSAYSSMSSTSTLYSPSLSSSSSSSSGPSSSSSAYSSVSSTSPLYSSSKSSPSSSKPSSSQSPRRWAWQSSTITKAGFKKGFQAVIEHNPTEDGGLSAWGYSYIKAQRSLLIQAIQAGDATSVKNCMEAILDLVDKKILTKDVLLTLLAGYDADQRYFRDYGCVTDALGKSTEETIQAYMPSALELVKLKKMTPAFIGLDSVEGETAFDQLRIFSAYLTCINDKSDLRCIRDPHLGKRFSNAQSQEVFEDPQQLATYLTILKKHKDLLTPKKLKKILLRSALGRETLFLSLAKKNVSSPSAKLFWQAIQDLGLYDQLPVSLKRQIDLQGTPTSEREY